MNKPMRTAVAALAAAFLTTAVAAQDAAIDAEVKKIDQSAGKITLKHGPAKSLGRRPNEAGYP